MQEEPMVALLRRLLSRRIGPGVYPFWHSKSYWRAVYRVALESSARPLFRRVIPYWLLLYVCRRGPADGGVAVAHPEDGVAGSDSLFPDHLEHLCVGLCDPL